MNPDPDTLIEAYLDDALSDSEHEALRQWLEQSPQNLQRFVEANVRDQQLRTTVKAEHDLQSISDNTVVSFQNPATRPSRRRLAFAAVAAVLAAGLFLLPRTTSTHVPVTIISASDVSWNLQESPTPGSRVSLSELQLEQGSLKIALSSGVEVELYGPAEAEFESAMRMTLHDGRLTADVGENGKGFTVVTDAGDVIDLGTQFGVEAERGGESKVAVFSGSVEFHPRDDSGDRTFVTLTEGEALRFSAVNGLRRWDQIALAAKDAGFYSGTPSGVVESVRDNFGNDELHPFYGVIPGGMQEGALAFTDKPNPKWQASLGQPFPEFLQGADIVRTYYRFRKKRDYELTLSLRQPATVYVLQDRRNDAPDWLRERFSKTEARLHVGPWHQAVINHPGIKLKDDGPHLRYEVWKAEAPAGEFILGPPIQDKPDVDIMMYGVVVKPLEPLNANSEP